jgi:hypothetical protein
MWQCGNDFWVIPRSFDGEKNLFCRIAAPGINCDFIRNYQDQRRKEVA